jgi:hypothetical protein
MPGHCWGTPDQIEFLTSHLPDFQDAQRNKTTAEFWIDVYREFFKRWPDSDAEVSAITVTEAVLKKARTKKGKPQARKEYSSVAEWTDDRKKVSKMHLINMHLINPCQQIVNWFNNRGANGKRVGLSAPVFNFGGESRVSSELQIYSRMYYESRVKERADLSSGLSGIQGDSSRLKIINKCTAEAWAAEDEDIKAIVRKEREAEVEEKERKKKGGKKSQSPEEYARSVNFKPRLRIIPINLY